MKKTKLANFASNYPNIFSFTIVGLWLMFMTYLMPNFINTSDILYTIFLYSSLYLLWFSLTFFYSSVFGKSKYWAILGFLGWLMVVGFRKKSKETENNKSVSSGVQFLSIFGVVGFAIYGFTTNVIGLFISLAILIFAIWYTKKH